jgi:hypothetical protein
MRFGETGVFSGIAAFIVVMVALFVFRVAPICIDAAYNNNSWHGIAYSSPTTRIITCALRNAWHPHQTQRIVRKDILYAPD